MPTGLKANVDGSAALQVGGTDYLTVTSGGNTTFTQPANLPNTFGFKNRIINGAMVIDQRNAGASGTATTYTVDRWTFGATQSARITWQQNAGSVTPPAGFTNYLGFTTTNAYSVTASDVFQILQNIEGFNAADLAWGTASAATVTLSFWVRSSLTGTFGGAVSNNALNRSYPFSYTISSANTWEQKSVTIPGDTTGTWLTNNGIGVRVFFSLGMGSTSSGTAGAWAGSDFRSSTGAVSVVGTLNATWYVTGVQLEKGSTATSFDYRPYGTELVLCQRYYEKSYPMDVVPGTSTGSAFDNQWRTGTSYSAFTVSGSFKVTKRASPTMTVYAENGVAGQASLSGNPNQACSINANTNGWSISVNTTGINVISFYYTSAIEL